MCPFDPHSLVSVLHDIQLYDAMVVNLIIPFMMDTQVIHTFSDTDNTAKGIFVCVYQCQVHESLMYIYLGLWRVSHIGLVKTFIQVFL